MVYFNVAFDIEVAELIKKFYGIKSHIFRVSTTESSIRLQEQSLKHTELQYSYVNRCMKMLTMKIIYYTELFQKKRPEVATDSIFTLTNTFTQRIFMEVAYFDQPKKTITIVLLFLESSSIWSIFKNQPVCTGYTQNVSSGKKNIRFHLHLGCERRGQNALHRSISTGVSLKFSFLFSLIRVSASLDGAWSTIHLDKIGNLLLSE